MRAEPAAAAIVLPTQVRLDELPEIAARLREELAAWHVTRPEPELAESVARLAATLTLGANNATTLTSELHAIATRADEDVRGMDFRLLYDGERKLFHIGFNVTADQVDANYYDLLASEARLASYLAIVKRDVPETHWYALGRPMTSVAGVPALLSWGGTMFEYLMPNLLMRSRDGTLLARTGELVVEAQMAWGRAQGGPWGVSESAFARHDANHTYQYRSFGVPGLGFKRGLDEDRVITPYASVLAVAIRPRAVIANIDALEALGMRGTYGLFEALDLTPDRAVPSTIVRSYMAHHQGMVLVSLANLISGRSMVDRFHADPMIATGELLLDEKAPDVAPAEWPHAASVDQIDPAELAMPHPPGPWSIVESPRPQAFAVGNGRLTSLVTDCGGGGLLWHGLALTRYQPDATHDTDGMWIYLRDEQTHRVWLATSSEGRTTYAMHAIELHRRNEGISVHVQIAVAPADDVELRLITLHNETDEPRRLTVTTAGRPVLVAEREAQAHPAFASMFVESELVEELDALVFARRPKSDDEARAVVVHRLVREGAAVTFAGYETDRGAFYGRGGSFGAPAALAGAGPLRGAIGAVLDPITSVMAGVELAANGTVTFAFVTTVASSRTSAVELARKYGSMHTVRWAIRDAELDGPRRLQRTKLDPGLLPAIQRLFSNLLFADPAARAAPDATARACKRRLWGHAISGDHPIVVARVHEPNAPLVRELLSAQRFLRWHGVKIDLVLVDEQATGYVSDGSGTLRRVLAQHDDHDWIGRHGGVHVLAADQLPEDERRQLEAAARAVLDTRDGSLGTWLDRTIERPAKQPRFEATLANGALASPVASPPRIFDNGTGGFSADGREYVISIPAGATTPAPWCNVIANEQFGCLVSESSLGVTWSLNSGENKLTPWRNDPVLDSPAEVLYLRDEETAAVWSPTPLPAGRDAATIVRHGAGYTSYERDSHGLAQVMTVFVPPDSPLKIVKLRIRNHLQRHRRLTATYYAEWVLGANREEQRPFIASQVDRDAGCLLATCNWNVDVAGRVAFVASKDKVHGYTTDRMEFLGRRGDYAHPEALERWGLSSAVVAGDPCAALQVHLELAPGEQLETHFVLGQAASHDEARALVARFRDGAAIETAWHALGAFWDDLLGNLRVVTPEPAMNIMLDRWLLYQVITSRLFGRIGFYQASGAFGFRDQLQDVLALLHVAPERTRAHILEAAAHQFEQGDVLHWWHPPAGRGLRTRCSDDLLWLPYVTAEYVAATGDVAILDEPVHFLTAEPLAEHEPDRYGEYAASAEPVSLFAHCQRAMEHGATEGAHGIPLMGEGDWNDGMNRIGAEGHGESVWLGWFSCATMNRFAGLCTRTGDAAAAATWRARATELRRALETRAWDGAWYLRAFHDDGSLVGSATSRECRIDSIAQSWAVLSSEHPDEHARAAVHQADQQLVRDVDRLVLLFWPPFDSTLHDPGYIRAYPRGIRENGGQYTHAATWLGWAHAALGDGERATHIFRLLNPILRTETAVDASRYRVEPYVLAADIYSCEPSVGRGGWTWYTGSAAWMWRLGVEAILGLQRVEGALRIAPCIPRSWPGFEAWVHLGRQRVHIVVENPDRAVNGVATITLDGVRLDGDLVRLDRTVAGTHEVRVRMRSEIDVAESASVQPRVGDLVRATNSRS